jgi:hypothetical protein
MNAKENCENTKLVGYDPTGESAVLCNEPGEYCPECEMALCASCHAEIATHPFLLKKPPAVVKFPESERKVQNS